MNQKNRIDRARPRTRDEEIDLTPDSGTRINWFPGHMVKAIRQVQEKMKLVDLVLEIRDARVPLTSGNSKLHTVLGQKGRIILFNKSNLADASEIAKWKNYFNSQDIPFLFVDALDRASLTPIITLAKDILAKRRASDGAMNEKKSLRLMILGLPNTGKSTLINSLVGKKITRAANRPGLTQNQQWVRVDQYVELLDTPGIMPPNIEREEQGFWLCAIHAIKDDIVGSDEVAYFVASYLLKTNPEALRAFYQLEELEADTNRVLEQIALKRKFLKKGGIPDLARVYEVVLSDFRQGNLGKYCFEKAPEME